MEDTTINVRGVRKSTWNEATRQASLTRELMGPWVTDALELRLAVLSGAILVVDSKDAPGPLTPDQTTARILALAELAKGLAALKTAGSRALALGALTQEITLLLTDSRTITRTPLRAVNHRSRTGQQSPENGQEPVEVTIDAESEPAFSAAEAGG